MYKSIAILICSLVIALAPYILQLPEWGDMLAPGSLGTWLPIIAGVVLSWLGQSPIGGTNAKTPVPRITDHFV